MAVKDVALQELFTNTEANFTPYTRLKEVSGILYEFSYSPLFTAEDIFYRKTGRKVEQIAEQSLGISILDETKSLWQILPTIAKQIRLKENTELINKLSQLLPLALLGTVTTFPNELKSTEIYTREGIALATFNETTEKSQSSEPIRIPYLYSHIHKVIHLPLDENILISLKEIMREKENIAKEIKQYQVFLYFPYEWEEYVSDYLARKELTALLDRYGHFREFKRLEDVPYKFSFLINAIKWAYQSGYSELWVKPVLGKHGRAVEVQIYGKLGTGRHISYSQSQTINPRMYVEILKDFTLRYQAELFNASLETLTTFPDSYTLKIGGIDTRWAFIPLGKHTSRRDIESSPPLAVIRVYSGEKKFSSLDDLNLPTKARHIIETLIPTEENLTPPVGLVAIAGRTDSGKSTLLGILAEHLAHRGLDVAMLEDPIERFLPYVNQTNVFSPADLKRVKYEEAMEQQERFVQQWLDTQLRANPDVVIVGEVRNELMMRKLLQLVKTGKLVFITVHASSTVKVLSRLVGLGMSLEELASDYLGSIFLTLIRKPNPEALELVDDIPLITKRLATKFPIEDLQLIGRDKGKLLRKRPVMMWKQNYQGDRFLGERIQLGTYALLTTHAKEKFSELLAREGLQRITEIKKVLASSSMFYSMTEYFSELVYRLKVVPLELAIHTSLAFDEVYPLERRQHNDNQRS